MYQHVPERFTTTCMCSDDDLNDALIRFIMIITLEEIFHIHLLHHMIICRISLFFYEDIFQYIWKSLKTAAPPQSLEKLPIVASENQGEKLLNLRWRWITLIPNTHLNIFHIYQTLDHKIILLALYHHKNKIKTIINSTLITIPSCKDFLP